MFRRMRKGTYDKQVKEMKQKLDRLYKEWQERPYDEDLIMKINGLQLTLEQFV